MNEDQRHKLAGDPLEQRIKDLPPPDPPDGLLSRCLETIGRSGLDMTVEPGRRDGNREIPRVARRTLRRSWRQWSVAMVPLAAVVLLGLTFFWFSQGAENLLAEVVQAFDRAATYHVRATIYDPELSAAAGSNSMETWLVRGVGRRTENRSNGQLVSVFVDDLRWRFQWDVRARRVSARPSEMLDAKADWPLDDYVASSRENFVQWGKRQKVRIVPQDDNLDGRKVEKVTLSWPDWPDRGRQVVWFDRQSRRPVKLRQETNDGKPQVEVAIDYPSPDAVPKERFVFTVPRDAELEVFDPQLGRGLSAEGQTGPDLRP